MKAGRGRLFAWCIRLALGLSALSPPGCQRSDAPAGEMAPAPPAVRSKSGIDMVLVPAGWFQMGSTRGKPDETPVRRVWVGAFLMDVHEVTQEDYGKLVLGNPSHFKGPRRPMEQISWAKAARYCNERSRAEGLEPCYDESTAECNFDADGYRLPTEAEWEYACRAGAETDYAFGSDPARLRDYAWFAANAAKTTHPVCEKKPNAWGLYDMHGNVAEWCNDVFDPNYYKAGPEVNPRGPASGKLYVLRGGAWDSSAPACRSSCRAGENPGFQDACFALDAIGFRCVRKAPMGKNVYKAPKTDPPKGTGLVYDEVYLKHRTNLGHPERPERLTAIIARLKAKGLWDRLTLISPAPAPLEWITAIHAPEYVAHVRKGCEEGIGYMDSGDTPVSAESYEAALKAAGGVMAAVDAVAAGKVRNAFCAVRPPGHHALKARAMGFCLFNNVAIAARYAQKKDGLAKVLIVDWDVHHGNGTQDAFYDDGTILQFDVHRAPFYPGSGAEAEKGRGKGLGFKINVPLPAGSGNEVYKQVFEEKLRAPAMAFKPDIVFISAGFDAAEGDPLGGMKITPAGYAAMTRTVRAIADQCCQGRLVSVLEGGYDLEALAASVEAHIRVLME
jgi:acetoin utilization deacetylase AcuC-like enzyme/formylglycine-generating enzyme required for sulfatase activity